MVKNPDSWLFTKCGRGVELGTTEKKSSYWQNGGLEPWTSRIQDQRPKPLDHVASTYCNEIVYRFGVQWYQATTMVPMYM